jgi:hypothetical protein
MKLLSLICLVGGALIAYVVFPNNNTQETKIQAPTQQTSVEVKDSISWFEKYLDIYIEPQLFTFAPTKYVNKPTDEVMGNLSLECWLGSFTISDITSDKNLITINCSKEEEFNKFIYITPNFFVITLYVIPDHGVPIGSSIIYRPDHNKLDDLEGIVITEVSGNRIEGLREHFSEQEVYVTQYGHYDLATKKFIVEYTD